MTSFVADETSWFTRLKGAISANKRHAHNRYFQVATNTNDGWPSVRTVVFRGFQSKGKSLLFVSDRRSNKIDEVNADARAEICWYFTNSKEQFRLKGELTILQDEGKIRDVWFALSDAAREQFFWLSPGQRLGRGTEPNFSADPPDSFNVLAFSPFRVDHLVLGREQTRVRSQLCVDGWVEWPINP